MPKSKHVTYAEKLIQKRLEAIEASDQYVAADIWGEVVYIFECYRSYELECLNSLAITVKEKVDRLELSVTPTFSEDNSEKTEVWENIFMSSEKLNRLSEIMRLAMQMAESQGLEVWTDTDDDNNQFWNFFIDFEEEDQ